MFSTWALRNRSNKKSLMWHACIRLRCKAKLSWQNNNWNEMHRNHALCNKKLMLAKSLRPGWRLKSNQKRCMLTLYGYMAHDAVYCYMSAWLVYCYMAHDAVHCYMSAWFSALLYGVWCSAQLYMTNDVVHCYIAHDIVHCYMAHDAVRSCIWQMM